MGDGLAVIRQHVGLEENMVVEKEIANSETAYVKNKETFVQKFSCCNDISL
jgi:hypothetical protein